MEEDWRSEERQWIQGKMPLGEMRKSKNKIVKKMRKIRKIKE